MQYSHNCEIGLAFPPSEKTAFIMMNRRRWKLYMNIVRRCMEYRRGLAMRILSVCLSVCLSVRLSVTRVNC